MWPVAAAALVVYRAMGFLLSSAPLHVAPRRMAGLKANLNRCFCSQDVPVTRTSYGRIGSLCNQSKELPRSHVCAGGGREGAMGALLEEGRSFESRRRQTEGSVTSSWEPEHDAARAAENGEKREKKEKSEGGKE